MQKKFNRLLAVMLVFIMGLTFLPISAFAGAEESQAAGEQSEGGPEESNGTAEGGGGVLDGQQQNQAGNEAQQQQQQQPAENENKEPTGNGEPAEAAKYTVEFVLPDGSTVVKRDLESGDPFPAPPEDTGGYTWTDGGGKTYQYGVNWPTGVGEGSWKLEGTAPATGDEEKEETGYEIEVRLYESAEALQAGTAPLRTETVENGSVAGAWFEGLVEPEEPDGTIVWYMATASGAVAVVEGVTVLSAAAGGAADLYAEEEASGMMGGLGFGPEEEPEETKVPLERVVISPAGVELSMLQGSMLAFTVTYTPGNATLESVAWEPENPAVATVSYDGATRRATVTAVSAGTTGVNVTITDQSGNTFEEYVVVSVTPAKYTLTYHSNYPADGKKFVYSNGNGTSSIDDAVDTRAEYKYDPYAVAAISEVMALANYQFMGWELENEDGSRSEAPASIEMTENVNLYATWGNKTTNTSATVTVTYRYGSRSFTKTAAAYINTAARTATFILINAQDTFRADSSFMASSLRTQFNGWTVSGSNYGFNATVTVPYTTSGGRYQVSAAAWVAAGATVPAQFFVKKIDAAPIGNSENYYSVGTGYLDASIHDVLNSAGHLWGSGKTEDPSGDVGSYVVTGPSANIIADLLEISVPEAMSIRWYVVKNQSDGFHVDGILYQTNKYWNVYFYDTVAGSSNYQLVSKYVVQDNQNLSSFPAPYDNAGQGAFVGWYDLAKSGSYITKIDHVSRDYYIYAKRENMHSVTGVIDHGDVSNGEQSVAAGGTSKEIIFTAEEGRYIKAVYVNNVLQDSRGYLGASSYTYPSQANVKKDIYVYVETTGKYVVDFVVRDVDRDKGTLSGVATATVLEGSAIGSDAAYAADPAAAAANDPTAELAYEFLGWWEAGTGGRFISSEADYDFTGIVPTGNITYEARFKATNKYNVQFVNLLDGTQNVTIGGIAAGTAWSAAGITAPAASASGYVFVGWELTENNGSANFNLGDGPPAATAGTAIDASLVYTARFARMHTVIFLDAAGNEIEGSRVENIRAGTSWAEAAIVPPAVSSANDEYFISDPNVWELVDNGGSSNFTRGAALDAIDGGTAFDADLTFQISATARRQLTVRFEVEAASIGAGSLTTAAGTGQAAYPASGDFTVAEGLALSSVGGFASPTAAAAPAANGVRYEFVRWYDSTGTLSEAWNYDFTGYTVNQSEVIYAEFRQVNTYRVRFVAGAGGALDEGPAAYGPFDEGDGWDADEIVVPTGITPDEHFAFIGWQAPNGSVYQTAAQIHATEAYGAHTFSEDLEFVALFEEDPDYNVTFTIGGGTGSGTLNGGGADVVFGEPETAKIYEDSLWSENNITVPAAVPAEGSWFAGWLDPDGETVYEDNDALVSAYAGHEFDGDLVFEAVFNSKTTLALAAPNGSKVYDGEALTAPYAGPATGIAGLAGGHRLALVPMTAGSTRTVAGETANVIDVANIRVVDGSGKNVTEQYAFDTTGGTLVVSALELVVRADTVTVGYTGIADDYYIPVGVYTGSGEDAVLYAPANNSYVSPGAEDILLSDKLDADTYEALVPRGQVLLLADGTPADPGSYTIGYEDGALVIEKAELVLTALPTSVVRPGEPAYGYSASGLLGGDDTEANNAPAGLEASGILGFTPELGSAYSAADNSQSSYPIYFTAATKAEWETPKNYNVTFVDASGEAGIVLDVTDSFTVTYWPNLAGALGDVPVDGNTYESGEEATIAGNTGGLNYPGLKVIGWTDGDGAEYLFDGSGAPVPGSITMTGNVDLYAIWATTLSAGDLTLEGFEVDYDGLAHRVRLVENTEGALMAGDIITFAGGKAKSALSFTYGGTMQYVDYVAVAESDAVSVSVERNGVKFELGPVNATIKPLRIRVEWLDVTAVYNGEVQASGNVRHTLTGGTLATGEDINGIYAAASARYVTDVAKLATINASTSTDAAGSKVHLQVFNVAERRVTTGNYIVETEYHYFKIRPATITVTADSLLEDYDGSAHTAPGYAASRTGYADVASPSGADVNISALGFAGAHTLTASTSGSITNVSENTQDNLMAVTKIVDSLGVDVYAGGGGNASIKVTLADGTLDLVAKKLTLTSTPATHLYDGEGHSADGFTYSGLLGTHTLSGVSATSGRFTDVNQNPVQYPNNFTYANGTGPVITDGGGNDVTSNYEVGTSIGYLNITPRNVTIYVGDASRDYNGQEHVVTDNGQASTTVGHGLVSGHRLDADTTGASARGTNPGSYGFVYDDTQNADGAVKILAGLLGADVTANYNITYQTGALAIDAAELSLVANSDAKVFDATALSNSGYSVYYGGELLYSDDGKGNVTDNFATYFPGHALSASVAGAITNLAEGAAGTDANGRYGAVGNLFDQGATTVTANGGDVSGYFILNHTDGRLKLYARPVEIGVHSAAKDYDGAILVLLPDANGASFDVEQAAGGRGLLSGHTVANAAALNDLLEQNFGITMVSENGTAAATPLFAEADILVGGTAKDNYGFTVTPGTLAINPLEITVVSNSAAKVYDATALTDGGYGVYQGRITRLADVAGATRAGATFLGGHSLDVDVSGTITGVAENRANNNTLAVNGVAANGGADVIADGSLVVHTLAGTLAITPRLVTLRARSSYGNVADGVTVHRVDGYDIEARTAATGLVAGHELSNVAAGAASAAVGNWPATFRSSNLAGPAVYDRRNGGTGNLISNYSIRYYEGVLEVVGGGGETIIITTTPEGPGPGPGGGGPLDPGGDDPTELVEPPVTPITGNDTDIIDPMDTPEAARPLVAWALLNLMLAVLSAVFAVLLFLGIFQRNKKRKEEEEEQQAEAIENEEGQEREERNPKSGIGWRIFSILAGIAAPIVFLLTENIRNPMVFTDGWTLLMVIITVVQFIGMLLLRRARNQEEDHEDRQDQQDQAPAQA